MSNAHKNGRTEQIVARIPLEDATALRARAGRENISTSGAVKAAIRQWLTEAPGKLADVELSMLQRIEAHGEEIDRLNQEIEARDATIAALKARIPRLPTDFPPAPTGALMKGKR